MSIRRFLIFAFAALGAVLALNPSALAQDYRIQRADYGWGDQRVDVTQRLRELAHENATFRMGNSTFGVDPAPGQVKTLRIFTIGANDQERMFEYREGSTVDGGMFAGWGRGDWGRRGADFVIVRALYGAEGRNVDVTDRLRDLARDRATFRMGNSTFGIDPAHGVVKTLRIFARGPNGRVEMFEYREGSTVDGAKFAGWGKGEWGRGDWHGDWNGEHDHDGDRNQ